MKKIFKIKIFVFFFRNLNPSCCIVNAIFAFCANIRNFLFVFSFKKTLFKELKESSISNNILSSIGITVLILSISICYISVFFCSFLKEITLELHYQHMNILVILILIFKFSYLILEKIDFKKFKHQIAMKLQLLKDFCFDLKYLISFLPLVVSASYAAFAVVPSSTANGYSTSNFNSNYTIPIIDDNSVKICLVGIATLAIGIGVGVGFHYLWTNYEFFHFPWDTFRSRKNSFKNNINYVHLRDYIKFNEKQNDNNFSFKFEPKRQISMFVLDKIFKENNAKFASSQLTQKQNYIDDLLEVVDSNKTQYSLLQNAMADLNTKNQNQISSLQDFLYKQDLILQKKEALIDSYEQQIKKNKEDNINFRKKFSLSVTQLNEKLIRHQIALEEANIKINAFHGFINLYKKENYELYEKNFNKFFSDFLVLTQSLTKTMNTLSLLELELFYLNLPSDDMSITNLFDIYLNLLEYKYFFEINNGDVKYIDFEKDFDFTKLKQLVNNLISIKEQELEKNKHKKEIFKNLLLDQKKIRQNKYQ